MELGEPQIEWDVPAPVEQPTEQPEEVTPVETPEEEQVPV